MRAEDIVALIASDVARHPDFFNSHAVNVATRLTRPEVMEFDDSFNEGKVIPMWFVLKERPDEEDGYLVVYDEASGMFGLAIYGTARPVFIGLYGSFTETLAAM